MNKLPYTAMIGYNCGNEQKDFTSEKVFKEWCENNWDSFHWVTLLDAETGKFIGRWLGNLERFR
jgi:hypothetical protein